MLSLIYVSIAQPGLSEDAVQAIAAHSAKNNASHDVTGMLAYNSRSFIQLLEGDGDAVLDIMRTIENDPRHGDITYIRQMQRDTRECPDWSMRALFTPLTGVGSASVFTETLPQEMELDTKILFTSFASSLTPAQAEEHARRGEQLMRAGTQAENDPSDG